MKNLSNKYEFSVLIPVYINDKKENVIEAIDSILNQTVTPSEVLILVDGPIKIEVKNALLNYEDTKNNIKLYFFEENRGLGLVLKDGVNLCKYEYIARMDADDVSISDRFEKQLKYMTDNNLDLVGSYIEEFNSDNNEKYIRSVPIGADVYSYAKKRNPFNHMTVIFKKNSVLEAGSYEDVKGFEDYYLWLKMIHKGFNMDNMPEVLVNARTDNFYNRRGGIKYIGLEYQFYKKLLQNGFIKYKDFIFIFIPKAFIRVLPNKFKSFIYKKFLRKRVQND